MKPILFCDFDGVINQFPYRWEKETDGSHDKEIEHAGSTNYGFFHDDFDDDRFFRADEFVMLPTYKGTFAISWSSEMVERLRNLILEDKVDFVWLTTWREEAVSLLNPLLGFPQHVNYLYWTRKMSDYSHAGKGHAVMDYFSSYPEQAGRKMVWIDDVATRNYCNWREGDGFMENKKAEHVGFPDSKLILLTDEYYGISRAEMKAIESFVSEDLSRL